MSAIGAVEAVAPAAAPSGLRHPKAFFAKAQWIIHRNAVTASDPQSQDSELCIRIVRDKSRAGGRGRFRLILGDWFALHRREVFEPFSVSFRIERRRTVAPTAGVF